MMRVILFTDSYWPRVNGLSVAVDGIADALRARGHHVMVVCPEYPEDPENSTLVSAGNSGPHEVMRLSSVPVVLSAEDRYCPTMGRYKIWQKIDEFKPDVIHCQSEFSVGGFGRRYAQKRRIPYVVTCHTDWEDYGEFYVSFLGKKGGKWFGRNYIKFMYRNDPVITVPTQPIAEKFTSYGFGERLRIISSGVDPAQFTRDTSEAWVLRDRLSARYPRLATGPILLFVGRIVREKNLRFLLQAFARVLQAKPESTLLLVGDGSYRQELEREAKDLGIDHACVFVGYVPYQEMASYYAMATVFVFSSLTETQGLVTVEAMLCGTPVVAIGALGTLDVMGGDNGGFMVGEDLGEFAGRVIELISDPELHRTKSADALARGKKCVTDNAMGRFVDLYEEMFKGAE